MSTTRKAPADQANKVQLYTVHRSLKWKGIRHSGGTSLALSSEDMEREDVRAWLSHGWISEDSLTSGSGKPIPQTASAELPAKGPAVQQQEGRFEIIQREKISPSPFNPRKDFVTPAAQTYLQELADSIRARGIIQPISVRPRPDTNPAEGKFELIAGECRWRGAGIAGLAQVPCIVRVLDDVAVIEVQTIENLQRRDINPMEEAHGYELLMRQGKYKMADLVRKTGKSEASIYARLKLLECPPGIRQAIEQDRLPASTGELVARLEPELRGAAMDAILHPEPDQGKGEEPGGVLSFRQAKAWVQMNEAKLEAEARWQKTVKGHHLHKIAGAVLTADRSNEILFGGGWLEASAKALFIKPGDVCYEDPEHRTWQDLAAAVGRDLPPPILACDPHGQKVVVLYAKPDAIAAMGDAIPDPEEYKRREEARRVADQEAVAERQRQRVAADLAEKAERARASEDAARLVQLAHLPLGAPDVEEKFLRFLVVGRFKEVLDYDPDDLIDALRDQGVPVSREEEYLDGCDAAKLRGWLTYFALRQRGCSDPDEEMIAFAKDVFGVTNEPQTFADEFQSAAGAA